MYKNIDLCGFLNIYATSAELTATSQKTLADVLIKINGIALSTVQSSRCDPQPFQYRQNFTIAAYNIRYSMNRAKNSHYLLLQHCRKMARELIDGAIYAHPLTTWGINCHGYHLEQKATFFPLLIFDELPTISEFI